jgi:hypothetical protein
MKGIECPPHPNGIESRFWEHKKHKTNIRSTKKNHDQVCAFCVSSFALFVFLDCVIRLIQCHCPFGAFIEFRTGIGNNPAS